MILGTWRGWLRKMYGVQARGPGFRSPIHMKSRLRGTHLLPQHCGVAETGRFWGLAGQSVTWNSEFQVQWKSVPQKIKGKGWRKMPSVDVCPPRHINGHEHKHIHWENKRNCSVWLGLCFCFLPHTSRACPVLFLGLGVSREEEKTQPNLQPHPLCVVYLRLHTTEMYVCVELFIIEWNLDAYPTPQELTCKFRAFNQSCLALHTPLLSTGQSIHFRT